MPDQPTATPITEVPTFEGRQRTAVMADSVPTGARITTEKVRLDSLSIDRAFQRPVDRAWVDRISQNWNPDGVGLLTVSRRANGDNILLDGQHRALAAIDRGMEDILCEVFHGLTHQQEAAIWNARNTTRAPHIIYRFRAAVTQGDPTATAIKAICDEAGVKIAWDGTGGVAAVDALYTVHRWGVLRDTLDMLRDLWTGQQGTYNRSALLGMAAFMRLHSSEFNRKAMVAKMASESLPKLLANAKTLASASTITKREWAHFYMLLVAGYNRQRRDNRLEVKPVPHRVGAVWGAAPTRGGGGSSGQKRNANL